MQPCVIAMPLALISPHPPDLDGATGHNPRTRFPVSINQQTINYFFHFSVKLRETSVQLCVIGMPLALISPVSVGAPAAVNVYMNNRKGMKLKAESVNSNN